MEEIKINDKLIELPIDSIVPHDGSHKTDDTAVQAIMQSIKDFGITQPISVDKNNVIVTGNGNRQLSHWEWIRFPASVLTI